jgi:hypothetical protein
MYLEKSKQLIVWNGGVCIKIRKSSQKERKKELKDLSFFYG